MKKANIRVFYVIFTLLLMLVLTSCASDGQRSKVKYDVEDGYLVCYVDNVKQVNTKYENIEFDGQGRAKSKGFVQAKQDKYYIQDDYKVALEYQIIEEKLYYFGLNGRLVISNTIDGIDFNENGQASSEVRIVITINGEKLFLEGTNVFPYTEKVGYYIEDGYVTYYDAYYGKLTHTTHDGYTFDNDGHITNQGFITIDAVTYYIDIDLKITIGYKVINNSVYNFGTDGKMVTGTHTDGYTYDVDGKLQGTNIFITIEGKTYYIIECVIVVGYQLIENYIYNFGIDGVMITGTHTDGNTYAEDGKLMGSNIFVEVEGSVYYIIDGMISLGYQVIENHIYNFGTDGKMITGTHTDGYTYSEEGYIVAVYLEITIDVTVYIIINNNAYTTTNVTGSVIESDHTMDPSDNESLSDVVCKLIVDGHEFIVNSTANGSFEFVNVPEAEAELVFERNGYITCETTVNTSIDVVLNIVLDKQVSNTLTGKVVIADADTNYSNNSSLAGALVEATRVSSTNTWVYETYTDANGTYTFYDLTAGVYVVVIKVDGYIEITQTVNVRVNQNIVQNQPIEAVPSTNVENGAASGIITDSKTGYVVSGVTVYIRAGINNTTGEVIAKVVTDSNGRYTVEGLAPGNYTAYVVDERELADEDHRYGSLTISIKVLANVTISNQNTTISNNIGLTVDGLRIVLTWGSTPSDLDSHLHVDRTSLSDYHVYYSNQNPIPTASLDVDDTSSYGPETITVSSIDDGIYHYVVHDYTNRSSTSSTYLSNSGATVTVYLGSSSVPAYTFYVPSSRGTCWHVFTYNSVTGEFVINNTIDNSNTFM